MSKKYINREGFAESNIKSLGLGDKKTDADKKRLKQTWAASARTPAKILPAEDDMKISSQTFNVDLFVFIAYYYRFHYSFHLVQSQTNSYIVISGRKTNIWKKMAHTTGKQRNLFQIY